jgi:hypothetical protein
MISVLNKKYGALLELLKIAHFNPKYPQLHSIVLTDRNRNFIYMCYVLFKINIINYIRKANFNR